MGTFIMFSTKSNPDYLNADLHQITLYNLKTRRWQIFKKWLIRLSVLFIIIMAAIFYGRYSLYIEQEMKRDNEIAIWLEQCEAFDNHEAIKPAIACYKKVLKLDPDHPIASENVKALENQYFQAQLRMIDDMQVNDELDNDLSSTLAAQIDEMEETLDKQRAVEAKIGPSVSTDNGEGGQVSENEDSPLPVQGEETEQSLDKPENTVMPNVPVATTAPMEENETLVKTTFLSAKTSETADLLPSNQDRAALTTPVEPVEKIELSASHLDSAPVVPKNLVTTISPLDMNDNQTSDVVSTTLKTDDQSLSETIEVVSPVQENESPTEKEVLADSRPQILPPVSMKTIEGDNNPAVEKMRQSDKASSPVTTPMIEKKGLDSLEKQAPVFHENQEDTLLSKKDNNLEDIDEPKRKQAILASTPDTQEKKPVQTTFVSDNSTQAKSEPLIKALKTDQGEDLIKASKINQAEEKTLTPVVSKKQSEAVSKEQAESSALISKQSEPHPDNQTEKNSALDMLLNIAASIHSESKKAVELADKDENLALKKSQAAQPVSAQTVKKSSFKQDMLEKKTRYIKKLLQECKRHFKANRLTTGKAGTAFQCYHEVLGLDTYNTEAKQGLKEIEHRYQHWAKRALKKGKAQRAKQYIQRLEKVNLLSPALPKLQEALARLEEAEPSHRPISRAQVKPRLNMSPIKASQESVKPRINTPPIKASEDSVKPRIKTLIQPPKQEQRHKAIYQPAKPSSPFKLQCSDIIAQESLGIRPLTQEQKTFKRQNCYSFK
jgi:hypothetical protein